MMAGWKRRVLALAAGLALVALWPGPAGAASPFSYYEPLPSGVVGVTQPVISVRIVLAEGSDPTGLAYRVTLDGREVPAAFDGQFLTYRPPAPLAAGPHGATASISFGGYAADLSWSFVVQPAGPSAAPSSALEELALRAVNEYRLAAGLDPLAADPALARAARSHAVFYATNADRYGGISLSVHEESASWPGFTGVDPWDRTAYWGYAGNPAENMAFARGTVEAVDVWVDSVYHRFPVLDPGALAAGFYLTGDPGVDDTLPVTVMEFGDWRDGGKEVPSSATVVYPAPNQSGVPLSFLAGEVPDPLSAFPGASYPAGYPVTLQFPSPHTVALQVTTATLATLDGKAVPAWVLAPGLRSVDPALAHLGQAVAILPKAPLKPLTSYRARIAGRYQDDGGTWHPFDRTWTFRTGRWDFPQAESIIRSYSGTTITALRLTCGADVSRASVYVDGRPVEALTHPTPETLQFALPAGTYTSRSVLTIQQPDGGPAERWVGFLGSDRVVVPGKDDWQPIDAVVGSARYPLAAGLAGGEAFLPVGLLRAQGASDRTLPGGEVVWADASGHLLGAFRWGDAVAYLPSGAQGLARLAMSLPPRQVGTLGYVPLDLAQKLLRPLGQFARYDAASRTAYVYPWLADVTGHWAEAEVRDLVGRGVISGFEDGLFHPSLSLSRAQFLKMLVASLVLPLRPGDTGGMPIAPNHWLVAQGWLGAAVTAGLVAPADYPGGFDPDAGIPRLEMAHLMLRWLGAAGKALPEGAPPPPFTDFGALSQDDADLVASLYAAGLIKGEPGPGGTLRFAGDAQMTRAEAAVVVERLLAYTGQGTMPAGQGSEAAPSR